MYSISKWSQSIMSSFCMSMLDHTGIETRETIALFKLTTLSDLFSANLAPSDNHLFGPLERGFQRQILCKWWRENCSDEVVQRTVKRILRGRSPSSRRWNISTEGNGDYVEKWGCDPLSTNFILMYDTGSCNGNYFCTKRKRYYFLTLSRISCLFRTKQFPWFMTTLCRWDIKHVDCIPCPDVRLSP